MQEIMKLTALQLGAAIRRGEVSPTEAVKAALERIEETAGDNAFTEVTAERALERAAWVEKDKALERRFQTVMVNEPDEIDAISILRVIKELYENHHAGAH